MSEWRHPQADEILARLRGEKTFKVGSIVRLKSGGPLMAVWHVGVQPGYESTPDEICCMYDDDQPDPSLRHNDRGPHRYYLEAATLELVE
jgi:uncharacterized protein YodC (DUF2158 family)